MLLAPEWYIPNLLRHVMHEQYNSMASFWAFLSPLPRVKAPETRSSDSAVQSSDSAEAQRSDWAVSQRITQFDGPVRRHSSP